MLDVLPEFVFFTTFTLLMLSWIEVYYMSRTLQRLKQGNVCCRVPVVGLCIAIILLIIITFIVCMCIGLIPITNYTIITRVRLFY